MINFKKASFVLIFALAFSTMVAGTAFAQAPKPAAQGNVGGTVNANAQASTNATCDELRKKFENAGGSELLQGMPIYCSVESFYSKFITFALFAAGIVAVIALIYGGFVYMTARGNDAQTKKGKSILIWAIIGLVVVLAAATIVNLITTGLVENRFV